MREIQAMTYTAQFDVVEDRIRLSINYENIENRCDFWITRRLFLMILPGVEQFLYNKAPECFDVKKVETPQFFQAHNKPLHQSKTNNEHQINQTKPEEVPQPADTALLALTQIEPLLLMNMEMNMRDNGLVLLTLTSSQARCVGFLEPKRLWDVVKMIFSIIPVVEWGLSPQLMSQG